jgi:urease accessory protein|tara:strand:- start:164 stop:1102 length:939 start_codon:yes stop_codon:yes gene_type:complete
MLKYHVIDSHDYYTPVNIPSEISQYDLEAPPLNVGNAGKVGLLVLVLENKEGKTTLVENYHKVPLQVQKALYIDENMPHMPFVYIMSPSGGILQGDRLRMDIHGHENTVFHITTQAATKIYRMEKNYATQILNITLDKGSYAEFLPDMIIPYRDSRFYQEVNLKIHEDATCLYSEILSPGRVTYGESFLYEIFYSRFQATDLSGNFRCLDNMVFSPKTSNLRSCGILGNWDIAANFYLLTKKVDSKILNAEIERTIQKADNIYFASTVLPRSDGIITRILGRKPNDVDIVCKQIWNIIREKLHGKPAPDLRK